MGQKRQSFQSVSHNHLLTISVNKGMSFGSHMGPTKHKPLRTREFLRFSARNCDFHLGHIFFEKKIHTKNRIFLCKTHTHYAKVSYSHTQTVDSL